MAAAAALNVLVDTTDDGNCFFSAVYGAAKFHPVAGTLTKLLNCLFKQGSPNGNVQDIGEADFIAAFRAEVARRIRGRTLEEKAATEGEPTLYDYLREQAENVSVAKVAGLANANVEEYPFSMLMADASEEVAEAFGDADVFLGISKTDFKKRLASIVGTDGVFVSEIDFNIIKYILGRCGFIINMVNPDAGPQFNYTQGGRPVLLLHRIANVPGAEHYQYFMPYDKYLESRRTAVGSRIVRKKRVEVLLEDRVEAKKMHATFKNGPKIKEVQVYKSGAGLVKNAGVEANVQRLVAATKAAAKTKVAATATKAAATKAAATKTRKAPSKLMMAMLNSNSSSA